MLSFTFFFAVFVSFVAAYIVPRAPGNWSNSLEVLPCLPFCSYTSNLID